MEIPGVPGDPFDPGQDGMDDVRCQVVVSAGDEALGPRDQELPSGSRFAVVRRAPTSLPAPGSVRHIVPPTRRQTSCTCICFSVLPSVMENQCSRTVGQAGIHQEGEIGA